MHPFVLIGRVSDVRLIAKGRSIRELPRLRRAYGGRRWRKLKGIATVELPDGSRARAEVHWYEADGVGRREMKLKAFL